MFSRETCSVPDFLLLMGNTRYYQYLFPNRLGTVGNLTQLKWKTAFKIQEALSLSWLGQNFSDPETHQSQSVCPVTSAWNWDPLFVCLHVCLSVDIINLSVCLSVCCNGCACLGPPTSALSFSVTLFVCPHVCLSVCLYICLTVSSVWSLSVLYLIVVCVSFYPEQWLDGVCPSRCPPALSSPSRGGFPGHSGSSKTFNRSDD